MQAAPGSRLSLMIVLVGLVESMSGLLIGYCTAVIAPALEFITRNFGLGGRSLELIEANLAAGRAVRDLGMPLPARSAGG